MRAHCRVAVCAAAGAGALSLCAGAGASEPQSGLGALLPRSGEMTGFTPAGKVLVLDSIAKDVASDPAAIRASDKANLVKDGFVTELIQSQDGPGGQLTGTAGLTRLRTHAAAESYEKFTFALVAKPGQLGAPASQVRYGRFQIPGVPGAQGAVEITRDKKVAHANMEWVEGDCMVQLGDGVASHTPLTAPLVTAAQSIYKRTQGDCE